MDERDGRAGRHHRALKAVLALLCCAAAVFLYRGVREGKRLSEELEETGKTAQRLEAYAASLASYAEKKESDLELYSDIPAAAEAARQKFFEDAKKLEQMVAAGETDVRIAYLTFDDGPYELTWKYLAVLSEHEVLGTFFQRGRDWDRFGEIYLAVRDGCHTMGNHTYSHKIRNGIYRSAGAFMEDLLKNREYLEEKLGVTTEVMRFPGGSSTAGKLKQDIIEQLRREHYAYVDWNGATGDGLYDLSANEYRDNVLNGTKGQKFLVVLMHDYNKNTLAALPEIIEGLREQGYVFLPLFYDSLAVNR